MSYKEFKKYNFQPEIPLEARIYGIALIAAFITPTTQISPTLCRALYCGGVRGQQVQVWAQAYSEVEPMALMGRRPEQGCQFKGYWNRPGHFILTSMHFQCQALCSLDQIIHHQTITTLIFLFELGKLLPMCRTHTFPTSMTDLSLSCHPYKCCRCSLYNFFMLPLLIVQPLQPIRCSAALHATVFQHATLLAAESFLGRVK